MLSAASMATVIRVTYRHGAQCDVLRIELDTPMNVVVIDLPNTNWSASNPSLMFMAYLGLSPSTVDEAAGEEIPVVIRPDGEVDVHPSVFSLGQSVLQRAEWFVG